jgi:hypothetical protein
MAQRIDIDELTAHAKHLAQLVSTWPERKLRLNYAQETTLASRTTAAVEDTSSPSKQPMPPGKGRALRSKSRS